MTNKSFLEMTQTEINLEMLEILTYAEETMFFIESALAYLNKEPFIRRSYDDDVIKMSMQDNIDILNQHLRDMERLQQELNERISPREGR